MFTLSGQRTCLSLHLNDVQFKILFFYGYIWKNVDSYSLIVLIYQMLMVVDNLTWYYYHKLGYACNKMVGFHLPVKMATRFGCQALILLYFFLRCAWPSCIKIGSSFLKFSLEMFEKERQWGTEQATPPHDEMTYYFTQRWQLSPIRLPLPEIGSMDFFGKVKASSCRSY